VILGNDDWPWSCTACIEEISMIPDHSSHAPSVDGGAPWLALEHARLDARLAAAFVQATAGKNEDARQELQAFRAELGLHLAEAEDRLFARLEAWSERALLLERLQWRAHVRDVQDLASLIARELRMPADSPLAELFTALRHALRRQRNNEARMLSLPERGPT
jgi:hypothetical protein